MNVFWPAINWNTFTLTKHTPNIRVHSILSLVCSTKWCVRLISEQHKQHTALTRSKKSDLHNIYITLLRFDPHLSIFMDIRNTFLSLPFPIHFNCFSIFFERKKRSSSAFYVSLLPAYASLNCIKSDLNCFNWTLNLTGFDFYYFESPPSRFLCVSVCLSLS